MNSQIPYVQYTQHGTSPLIQPPFSNAAGWGAGWPPPQPMPQPVYTAANVVDGVVNVDFADRQAFHKRVGDMGERIALQLEQEWLRQAGRPDLACMVRPSNARHGNVAPYDIDSFYPDDRPRYVEVKATTGAPSLDFFMSQQERAFAWNNAASYCLYRIYHLDLRTGGCGYFVLQFLENQCSFEATKYRVKPFVQ